MRIEGVLKQWNPERGVGLIAPDKGGDDVFVHIKAFGDAATSPQEGRRVSFEVSVTWEGKLRARHAQLLGADADSDGWGLGRLRRWLGPR